MIDLIIFDMDGVIFDSERVCMEIFLELGKEYGLPLEKEHYTNIIATTHEITINYLKECFGEENEEKIEYVLKECMVKMDALSRQQPMPLKRGLMELLDYLDKKGYKKAVASSSPLSTIERYLEASKLTDRFDFLLSGKDCKAGKPNPEIFLKTLEHFQIPAERAIVLEDSINGIMAAKNGNIKCVAIPDLVMYDKTFEEHFYAKKEHLGEVIQVLEFLNAEGS